MNIRPIDAPEPGGLAGFEWVCTTCDMPIRYSLESMVIAEARAHRAWHDRQDRLGARRENR